MFKVDFPRKGIVELYAKIFYTSCWIDFLATYSKVKVLSLKFSFKDNCFSFTCIQSYFVANCYIGRDVVTLADNGLYVCLLSSKTYWCTVSLCHQQNDELSYVVLVCEGHLYIKGTIGAQEQILVEHRV